VVAGGGRHGSYLRDLKEQESCPGLKEWPAAIDWVTTQQAHEIEGPLGFTPDEPALRAIWNRINELAPDREHRKVEAIFTGKVESRRDIQIYRVEENGELGWMGYGYGHLGQFPAQLIVKSMTDVLVEFQGQGHEISDGTKK
jgi:hypothetical protein